MIDSWFAGFVILDLTLTGFYIGNWAYRFFEENYYDLIAVGGGVTETLIGLCGLVMTLVLYRLRIQSPAAGTYFAFTLPSTNGIYTLPFVTSGNDKSGIKGYKPQVTDNGIDSDTQSLLKLLEEDQLSNEGPYNHSLSVPINQGIFLA